MTVGDALEEPYRVPGKPANGAAGEAWQARDLRGVRTEVASERREKAALLVPDPASLTQYHPWPTSLEGGHRVAADERVAGLTLASHDALEQKCPLGASREGEEGRHRCAKVSRHLTVDRNWPATFGEPLVLLVALGLHHPPILLRLSTSATRENGTPL